VHRRSLRRGPAPDGLPGEGVLRPFAVGEFRIDNPVRQLRDALGDGVLNRGEAASPRPGVSP
jgi:hypothetical protein